MASVFIYIECSRFHWRINCSCDDRISKLLKYKLSGREIELCELSEKDFEEINEG